jgi:hypothetical protein
VFPRRRRGRRCSSDPAPLCSGVKASWYTVTRMQCSLSSASARRGDAERSRAGAVVPAFTSSRAALPAFTSSRAALQRSAATSLWSCRSNSIPSFFSSPPFLFLL